MKTILIADIKSQEIDGKIYGHYVPVARNYLDIFKDSANIKVTGGPIFSNFFKPEDFFSLPYNNTSDNFSEKLKTFVNAIVLFVKGIGKTIILQQSTTATSFVAIALFYWWTGKLFLIQYNTDGLSSRLKRFLYFLAKHKISGFIVPNDRVGNIFRKPYCVVTDYIKTKCKENTFLYSEREWDFGIIGTIFKDKGVIEAIEFFGNKDCKVLVAGNVAEPNLIDKIEKLKNRYTNLDFRIGYLSDYDFNNLISRCRYCVLNYRGTYFDRSSGVVFDIIFNHTPVIGTRCNALKIVEDEKLGRVYDDISELNISQLLDEANYQKYLNAIGLYYHKQEKYKQNLIEFVGIKKT